MPKLSDKVTMLCPNNKAITEYKVYDFLKRVGFGVVT
jgi:hypothetical protein